MPLKENRILYINLESKFHFQKQRSICPTLPKREIVSLILHCKSQRNIARVVSMGKSPPAIESIMMELFISKNASFTTSRLRYCPSCSQCVIASGANGAINLFDLRKLPSSPIDIYMHPENTFLGQSSTCHGLDWSVVTDGRVAAGSDDGKVCVWDALGNSQQPIVEYRVHQQAISVEASPAFHL